MVRRKPTDQEMETFWSYVTGRRQEKFELPDGFYGNRQPKTIPPENYPIAKEQDS